MTKDFCHYTDLASSCIIVDKGIVTKELWTNALTKALWWWCSAEIMKAPTIPKFTSLTTILHILQLREHMHS